MKKYLLMSFISIPTLIIASDDTVKFVKKSGDCVIYTKLTDTGSLLTLSRTQAGGGTTFTIQETCPAGSLSKRSLLQAIFNTFEHDDKNKTNVGKATLFKFLGQWHGPDDEEKPKALEAAVEDKGDEKTGN